MTGRRIAESARARYTAGSRVRWTEQRILCAGGDRLKRGAVTLSEVIKDGSTDDVIGKMKVSALLESLPGVGKVRAKQIMERLGIAESRRVRGLGANQRAALEQEFGADL